MSPPPTFLNTWSLGRGATLPHALTNLWCGGWDTQDPHFYRRWKRFLTERLQGCPHPVPYFPSCGTEAALLPHWAVGRMKCSF